MVASEIAVLSRQRESRIATSAAVKDEHPGKVEEDPLPESLGGEASRLGQEVFKRSFLHSIAEMQSSVRGSEDGKAFGAIAPP